MNEKELAAELQAGKDLDEWGDPEVASASSKAGPAKLSAMVSVRLAPEELQQVQRRAQENGRTVSAYLRSLAVRDLDRPVQSVPNFRGLHQWQYLLGPGQKPMGHVGWRPVEDCHRLRGPCLRHVGT